jgi:hypothetical protein
VTVMKTTFITIGHAGLLILSVIVIGIPEARTDAVAHALRLSAIASGIFFFWRARRNGWLGQTFSQMKGTPPTDAPGVLEMMASGATAVAVVVVGLSP